LYTIGSFLVGNGVLYAALILGTQGTAGVLPASALFGMFFVMGALLSAPFATSTPSRRGNLGFAIPLFWLLILSVFLLITLVGRLVLVGFWRTAFWIVGYRATPES
jgi:hypothetical protein